MIIEEIEVADATISAGAVELKEGIDPEQKGDDLFFGLKASRVKMKGRSGGRIPKTLK